MAVYLQVIEDSVAVVAHVRKQRAVPKATPNIVVGGSYGKGARSPQGLRPGINAATWIATWVAFCSQEVATLVDLY